MTPAKKAPAAKAAGKVAGGSRGAKAPAEKAKAAGAPARRTASSASARQAPRAHPSPGARAGNEAPPAAGARARAPVPSRTAKVAPVATSTSAAVTSSDSAAKSAGAPPRQSVARQGPGTGSGRTAGSAARRSAGKPPAGPYAGDAKFLLEQKELLEHERNVHREQAADLRAEADSLAQEREPGDVQFDEESGEGGTVTVDRERDLALSAQAMAAVEEIEAALLRIADGSYGACERCHQPIPKPRLRALPYARLCVACKSGGLSRR
ncbi:MAG TPA: TraR/DksA family transcriptional regulator [Acidimicrobiales bacterium]|nr:TraR/DksA family transcriptional regulator [Acidimicrobiales bacterium]